jgi:hypothetical protein
MLAEEWFSEKTNSGPLVPSNHRNKSWMETSLFHQAVDILETSTIFPKLNACLFSVDSIRPRIANTPRMPLRGRTYRRECTR